MSDLDPARIGCITASKITDMLAGGKGITRARYAGILATERLSGKAHRSGFSSAALDHGKEFEPMARMKYEIRNGVMVLGTGVEFTPHPFIANAGASLDGMVDDDGVVEFKNPDSHTHIGYLLAGEVPPAYKPQMLWQLACSRRKWADFVSHDPDADERDGYFQIRYIPTAKEIAELESEVRRFDVEVELLMQKIISLRGTK